MSCGVWGGVGLGESRWMMMVVFVEWVDVCGSVGCMWV